MNIPVKKPGYYKRSPYLIDTEKVKLWKEHNGVSDEELAVQLHYSQSAISRAIRNANCGKKLQRQLAALLEQLSKGQLKAADVLINRFEQEGAAQ